MKTKKNGNRWVVSFIAFCIIAIGAIFGIPGFEEAFDDILVSNDYEMTDDVYESNALVNVDGELKIHFIDQTTPNMIQGLKGVFARKPLISRGI